MLPFNRNSLFINFAVIITAKLRTAVRKAFYSLILSNLNENKEEIKEKKEVHCLLYNSSSLSSDSHSSLFNANSVSLPSLSITYKARASSFPGLPKFLFALL